MDIDDKLLVKVSEHFDKNAVQKILIALEAFIQDWIKEARNLNDKTRDFMILRQIDGFLDSVVESSIESRDFCDEDEKQFKMDVQDLRRFVLREAITIINEERNSAGGPGTTG